MFIFFKLLFCAFVEKKFSSFFLTLSYIAIFIFKSMEFYILLGLGPVSEGGDSKFRGKFIHSFAHKIRKENNDCIPTMCVQGHPNNVVCVKYSERQRLVYTVSSAFIKVSKQSACQLGGFGSRLRVWC